MIECFLEVFLSTHQEAKSLPDFRFGLPPCGDQHGEGCSGVVLGMISVFMVL